jgi:hypothetical protein
MMKTMSVTSLRDHPRSCPICHTVNDGVTGVNLESGLPVFPEPGQMSICSTCCAVMIFTETSVRLATDEEWAETPDEVKRFVGAYMKGKGLVPRPN